MNQKDLWNGRGGNAWVDAQEALDRMFLPFEERLADTVPDGSAQAVLDVGCGTGATTLAVARRLGAHGRAVGIDISAPMVEHARARARQAVSPARFIVADAQNHPFERATFDLIVSRFGVMFFSDPVAAFANLRRATAPGGALRVIAWRGPDENPFMTAAERAAAPLLPDLPARQPDEPGQFAFADAGRVAGILGRSGWTGIDIQPLAVDCSVPLPDLERYMTRLGPVGGRLQDLDPDTRSRVVAAVRRAFDPFVHGEQVAYTALCWEITAGTRD